MEIVLPFYFLEIFLRPKAFAGGEGKRTGITEIIESVRVALVVLGISSPVFAQEDATEGSLPVPNYSGDWKTRPFLPSVRRRASGRDFPGQPRARIVTPCNTGWA